MRLRTKSEKLAAGSGEGDDDEDESEDEDLEEELGYVSPLDTVNAYMSFKNSLPCMCHVSFVVFPPQFPYCRSLACLLASLFLLFSLFCVFTDVLHIF